MESKFHFRVRAVIQNNGSVLVTKYKEGKYNTFLPGGHIEAEEMIVDALKRELKEELGIEISNYSYLGAIEQTWAADDLKQYEINHFFKVEVPELTSEANPPSMEDKYEYFWAKPSEFESINLLPFSLRDLLKEKLSGDNSIWWASDKAI